MTTTERIQCPKCSAVYHVDEIVTASFGHMPTLECPKCGAIEYVPGIPMAVRLG